MSDTAGGEAPRTCFHHTDRETGLTCTRCGRPACWQCLTDAPVGAHCWQCINAARPPLAERARRASAGQSMLVTKVLVGLNAAVFVAALASGGTASNRTVTDLHVDYALFGPAVAAGEWWRLVTSGFLHYGLLHVAFNCLILWQLGQFFEDDIGRARFAALFTVSLLGGSVGALLVEPEAFAAGASGAVFGLAGASTFALWRRGVPFTRTPFGPLLLINLALTFTIPQISVGGHLGGLVAGVVAGAVVLARRDGVRRFGFAVAGALAVASLVASVAIVRSDFGTCEKVPQGYACTGGDAAGEGARAALAGWVPSWP